MPEGHGACKVYRRGWANAFRSCGHEVFTFDPATKPVMDAFSEVKPDTLFAGTYELDRAFVKALASRPDCRVILWADHYGQMDSEIDWERDPIGRANDRQKKMVEEIVKTRSSPSLCPHAVSYYSQRCIEKTHDGWRGLGLEPLGLPLACDVLTYPLSEPMDELRCDAVMISGNWPYKGQNLREFFYPLCHPSSGLKVKVFGAGEWHVGQRVGVIAENLISRAYASAAVSPAVFEPLATRYDFDVSERPWKALGSGGFVVSQRLKSMETDLFTQQEVVFVNTPAEMMDAVVHYSRRPEERLPYMRRGQCTIYGSGTYHHRLSQLLGAILQPISARHVMSVYDALLPQVWREDLRPKVNNDD